jgi:hypothetical protein
MQLRPYQTAGAAFLLNTPRSMVLAPEWAIVPSVWEYREGKLYWRIKAGRGTSVRHPGDEVAPAPDPHGYQFVTLRRKHYAVHRVVFLLVHGWLPKFVDHIDGNPGNNLVANLRPATHLQNMRNAKTRKDNTSGVKNVYWHKQVRRWQVRLSIAGKQVSFGCFATLDEASAVAAQARADTFGEFARHA